MAWCWVYEQHADSTIVQVYLTLNISTSCKDQKVGCTWCTCCDQLGLDRVGESGLSGIHWPLHLHGAPVVISWDWTGWVSHDYQAFTDHYIYMVHLLWCAVSWDWTGWVSQGYQAFTDHYMVHLLWCCELGWDQVGESGLPGIHWPCDIVSWDWTGWVSQDNQAFTNHYMVHLLWCCELGWDRVGESGLPCIHWPLHLHGALVVMLWAGIGPVRWVRATRHSLTTPSTWCTYCDAVSWDGTGWVSQGYQTFTDHYN